MEINNIPTPLERQLLKSLVRFTDLDEYEQQAAYVAVDNCTNYTEFQSLQFNLEERQLPIDQIQNPSQRDINNHLKKVVG